MDYISIINSATVKTMNSIIFLDKMSDKQNLARFIRKKKKSKKYTRNEKVIELFGLNSNNFSIAKWLYENNLIVKLFEIFVK